MFIPARSKRSSTKHPAVREVRSRIPTSWGDFVMACVVLKPGMVLSADDLTSYCRRFLANYKVHDVEFSDAELPKRFRKDPQEDSGERFLGS